MRNALESVYQRTLFPFQLYRKFGPHFKQAENELHGNLALNRDQLEEKSRDKLKRLLLFASQHNAFYKGYDIDPSDDVDKTLRSLPVLEKTDITRIPLSQMTTRLVEQHKTSGSTGIPVRISTDERAESYRRAAFYRFLHSHGINIFNKNVLIWGLMKTDGRDNGTLNKIKNSLFERTYLVNVFRLNAEMDRLYDKMLRFKPRFIRSYKSGVLQMCQLMKERNMDPRPLTVQKVISTSEILFPEERRFIEAFLGVKLYDEYGASEVGLIAGDCPYQNKHIYTDRVYYFLNQEQELILTDLDNYLTPVINYKIGDRLTIDHDASCPCGSPFPVIKRIEGRQGDQILTPAGQKLSQFIIYYIVNELTERGYEEAIAQYKVVQSDLHAFTFYYKPDRNFHSQALQYVEQRLKEEIGTSITVHFEEVAEIPRDNSGKIRFFKGLESPTE
jgi:phenylacetate-CoA ligase